MLMVRKIVLSIAAILFASVSVFAQNKQITGTVTSTDGKPVAGATVVVEGTNIGTSTDMNGKYTISAPSNGLLTFSFIGYVDTSIAVNSKTIVNATLSEDTENIDEVIVVGYGSGRKVGSIIGSVEQVKADKLQERPTNNVMDAMQGQVAGLQIFSGMGELSAESTIRLHGMGSISAGNEPLILLDGAPITTGTLMQMNSNDIASISVLKDASATSIYGSRAANGVIYVTTKKGSRGQENAVVTLRTQFSLSSPVDPKMERMSTNELLTYAGNTLAVMNKLDFNNPEIADMARAAAIKMLGADEKVNVNWWDEILKKNAPMYQVDLGISGGTQKTAYYVSASYIDQEGIAPGSTNSRYTFRTNVDAQVKKWLKVGMNLGVAYSDFTNAYSGYNSSTLYVGSPMLAAIMIPSYQSNKNKDGSDMMFLDSYMTPNPKYMHLWTQYDNNRLQLNGSAFVEVKPVKGLILRSQLSSNAFDYRSTSKSSPDEPTSTGVAGTGSVRESFQRSYSWTITNTAEYKHTIAGEHNLTALAGHESIYGSGLSFGIGTKAITNADLLYLNKGTEITSLPSYSTSKYAYNSAFFRAEYNYAEKYFVDASVRYDACSRFGIENRGAIFWSAGAMWNLKKEAWLKDVSTISNLSIKASYGTQGNSGIGNYDQYETIASGSNPYMGTAAWYLDNAGNPRLAWEQQSTLTIGAQVELWKKLAIGIDWYRRQTSDMLMPMPLAPSSGFSSQTANIGAMRNSGVDFNINYNIFQNKDWYVSAYANFNYNKNQLTKLWEEGLEDAAMNSLMHYVVGKPYGEYYMPEYRGVNPKNGAPQWTAADGGITENFNEAVEIDMNKSTQAPWSGGFGFYLSWKGIGLNADFSWVAGNYLVNNTLYFAADPMMGLNGYGMVRDALDYWKKPGDVTKYPALSYRPKFDSNMLEDASFLRLKNIQLSYTLPRHLLKGNKVISGFKVFVGARNLFTATKYGGFDPEVASGDIASDVEYIPNARQWTFGCEFKF